MNVILNLFQDLFFGKIVGHMALSIEDSLERVFFHPAFDPNFPETASAKTTVLLITCKGKMEVENGEKEEAIRAHNRDYHFHGSRSCIYQIF